MSKPKAPIFQMLFITCIIMVNIIVKIVLTPSRLRLLVQGSSASERPVVAIAHAIVSL